MALALGMRGVLDLLRNDLRVSQVTQDQFQQMVRLVPYSAEARNLDAVVRLSAWSRGTTDQTVPELIVSKFKDAIRADPENELAYSNLEALYRALENHSNDFEKRAELVEGARNEVNFARERVLIAEQMNAADSSKGAGQNWIMATGDYGNLRYSNLKQIDVENVHNLSPVWSFSTGVLRGHEGAPLVIGDVMYVHTPFPNIVYALDLNNDGKILWKYEPKQDPNVISVMCCDTVNRGLAYGDGKIFLHQADTTLVALDAETGKVVWSAKDGDPSKGQTGTNAPMVIKDKVFIGVSGGEFGVRGWLSAYDMKTGKLVWRAYSEGPDSDILVDPEKTTVLGKPIGKDSSLKTWEGDQWKIGGGDP